MCRRKSGAMHSIEAMCVTQGLDSEELAAKAKLLLGSYRRICWTTLGACKTRNNEGYCICNDAIDQAMEYLKAYSSTVEKGVFEKNLRTLFDSRWMVELVDDAMIQVKEFPDTGDQYFEIISKFYLDKFKYCESELLEVLKLERSSYYDRKKEAVLVFGLALWGTVLPKIERILQEEDEDYQYVEVSE